MSDDVRLVRAHIEATHSARETQLAEDFAAMHGFLDDALEIRVASAWADAPWPEVYTTADRMIERMKAPINNGSSQRTANANVMRAGAEVLVEHQSKIVRAGRSHLSLACHIFTVEGGKIAAIRTYRYEDGIPPGCLRAVWPSLFAELGWNGRGSVGGVMPSPPSRVRPNVPGYLTRGIPA